MLMPPAESAEGNVNPATLEHREAARLRSERWRRAHGIGPRRLARWPWLAGIVSLNFSNGVESGHSLKGADLPVQKCYN